MSNADASLPAGPMDSVPGPADRELFFAVQRRQRRAAWRFAVLAFLAVLATGIPLGIAIAPLLYLASMPVATLMLVLFPQSLLWGMLRYAVPVMIPALTALTFLNVDYSVHQSATDPWLFELHGEAHGDATAPSSPDPWTGPTLHRGVIPGALPAAVLVLMLLVLPGALALLVAWRLVRRVLRRAGPEGILATLQARAADPHRAAEQRLVNLVQEMALAAALPPPRVMVVDRAVAGAAVNAMAVGWKPGEATVVVTESLVEDLPREQAQSLIAQVVASIGNGSLPMALVLLSVFETVALVRSVFHGAARWSALRALLALARMGLRPDRSAATPANRTQEENAVRNLLLRETLGAAAARPQDLSGTPAPAHRARRLLLLLTAPVRLPLRGMAFTIWVVVTLSALLFAGPVAGAMWRRRQLLADAMAVQLTRDPDALASALRTLARTGVMLPGASAYSFLFAAWPQEPPVTAQALGQSREAVLTHGLGVPLEMRLAALQSMGAAPAPAADPQQATPGSTNGAPWTGHSLVMAAVGLPAAGAFLALVLAIDLVCMSITLGAAGGLMSLLSALAQH